MRDRADGVVPPHRKRDPRSRLHILCGGAFSVPEKSPEEENAYRVCSRMGEKPPVYPRGHLLIFNKFDKGVYMARKKGHKKPPQSSR